MKQVAAIALLCDHHILMGRRRDNQKFTNPGGHLNPGEDPLKGAVREVKEETGIDIDPRRLEHVETRIVKKPDGTEIKVHGYKVHLLKKPLTSMREDPDNEVYRWRWINIDKELSHISHELHVPLGDNVLLDHIIKAKPQRRHIQHVWTHARRIGMSKRAEELLIGGKADGKSDSDFPQDQLRMGRKVEREHTNNPAAANEVARDHLTEDKKYYTHLKEMEEKYVEKTAFWNGFEKRGSGDAEKGFSTTHAGYEGALPANVVSTWKKGLKGKTYREGSDHFKKSLDSWVKTPKGRQWHTNYYNYNNR